MSTVTLSDGRTIALRPMYISEKQAILAVNEEATEDMRLLDYVGRLGAIIEPAIVPGSWAGSVFDMTETQLIALLAEWHRVTEDDALPPENGTDSATK